MKKFALCLLAAVMMVSMAFAEDFDIRKLRWGMSFDEIQQAEGLKDSFYKEEQLLGVKVEIIFGFGGEGLYSVTYSTRERVFAEKAGNLMNKKYGEPKKDLDYSFLLKSKDILEKYPVVVVKILEGGDFSKLEDIKSTESTINVKKIIKAALTKRAMWEYKNTVALLLDSVDGAVLSYWAKNYHNNSKMKFQALLAELKKKAEEAAKKADDADKF
jgi:hypothetical protein